MSNYDNDVLGVGNSNHPANQNELTDREMLTEVYNVNSDILEIFDRAKSDADYYYKRSVEKSKKIIELECFIRQIKETVSPSGNGICIIVKNQIENFLNK